MAFISSNLPASIGDVTVDIEAPTEGALAITTSETTGAFSISAGARWVQIRNAGFVQDGDAEADATIQGQSWSPGREERWEAVMRVNVKGTLLMCHAAVDAMRGTGRGAIVNLASVEYAKAALRPALRARVVDCVFEEHRSDGYRIVSFFAKRARGMMARFAVQQRVRRVRQLEAFAEDGYTFDRVASTRDRLVFRRAA